MTSPSDISLARERLMKAGMADEDVSWLDARRWNDAAIPPVMWPCDTDLYRRREALLNKAIQELGAAKRSESLEAKLAAAIGARLANWGE